MHDLVAAQDGICGACIDAQGTTDAPSFVNHGHRHGAFSAMVWIQGNGRATSDLGQHRNAFKAPGGALIDGGIVVGNGLCIGFAVGVAAPCALRLGQRIMDAIGQ